MMLSEIILRLVEEAVASGHLARRDVWRIVSNTTYDPDAVRLDLARWLADVGLLAALGIDGRRIGRCPIGEKELRAADERNEIPLVVPAGLRREHLARAFGQRHWVFTEPGMTSEEPDAGERWLLVSASDSLFKQGDSCVDACTAAGEAGLAGLSLEEYVLFAYRLRYLTGVLPDRETWTWLPRTSYASLVVCAGFPDNSELFVNIWPSTEFHSNVGLRVLRAR
jgi:hypothetical protein